MKAASTGHPLSSGLPAALLGTLLVLTGLAAGDLLRWIRLVETICGSIIALRCHLLRTLDLSDLVLPRIILLIAGTLLLASALLVRRGRSRERRRD